METFSNISNTSYDFDDDSFDDISEEATDFISKLLVKSKMERLTASQCLSHNWLGQARGMSLKTINPGMEFFITV
jgi:myosin-light-chain kinase